MEESRRTRFWSEWLGRKNCLPLTEMEGLGGAGLGQSVRDLGLKMSILRAF